MCLRTVSPINNMFRTLVQHWKGNFSLWTTIVVIFIPSSVLVLAVLHLNWVDIADRLRIPTFAMIVMITTALLVVVIWQVTGLLRTLNAHMAGVGGVADSGYVYLLLFVYAWLLLLAVLDLSRFVTVAEQPGGERPQTAVSVRMDDMGRSLHIRGDLEFGLTRRVVELLEMHTDIKHLTLSSAGGIVSEARGVAKLVMDRKLSTHVDERCFSACTLVFIASDQRTLGAQGELGFHQYSMEEKYNTPWIDPVAEQRQDAGFMLSQGVAQQFIDRAFSEPHTQIWRPSHQVLLEAGVVTEVLP